MTLLEDRPAAAIRNDNPDVLHTARLILRPPCADDARAIAALANDIRIAQNTTRIPYPYALSDAHAWLRVVGNGAAGASIGATWLVTLRDGTMIGACGVEPMHAQGKPELGYWLGTHYWGHGYATEAARAAIDHAFSALDCTELHSGARISNPASRRVLEKCGFQWSGVGLYRIRSLQSSAPIDRFRLDRGIWSSLKSWGRPRHAV